MDSVVWVLSFYAVTIALHVVLPGRIVEGYVVDSAGKPLKYKLNGLQTLLIETFLFAVLSYLGFIDGSFLSRNFFACTVVAFVMGIVVTLGFYLRGIVYPQTRDWEYVAPTRTSQNPTKKGSKTVVDNGFLYNFYVGFQFNPRVGLFDVKMFLYLFGAVLLQLNILSALIEQYQTQGSLSNPMMVDAGMLTFFVTEYMYHEHIHLYTYDLFAEKIGFKLAWGCLVFYPFFYSLSLRSLIPYTSDEVPVWVLFVSVFLFSLGWVLSRGANNQKYYFRTSPKEKFFFGLIEQKTVGNSKILCSGWWSLARHINYAGEILMGIAIALPAGFGLSIIPWTYPAYYIAILVPRELEDDRVCETKHQAAWREYRKLVPYRIFPYLY